MNAHASSCFVSAFVSVIAASVIAAPVACALEPGQQSSPILQGAPAMALPAFIDAARVSDFEAAWRARFASASAAAMAARPVSDPEAGTIDEARAALSRAEQISLTAAAVRDRAEELSRRFAVEPETPSTAAAATPAADDVIATVAPAEAAPAETGSVAPASAPSDVAVAVGEPEAQLMQVSAPVTPSATASIDAPVSMLGGPPIEDEPTASAAAPVIENLATKPAGKTAKRTLATATRAPVDARPAAPKPPPRESYSLAISASPTQPDQHIMMPTELRAFGWGSQPD